MLSVTRAENLWNWARVVVGGEETGKEGWGQFVKGLMYCAWKFAQEFEVSAITCDFQVRPLLYLQAILYS